MICLVCSHLLPKLDIFGESQYCPGWWNIWPLTSCRKFQSLAVFQRRKYVHQGGWSLETHQCIIALIEKTWRVPTKIPSNHVEKCHKTRRIKTTSKIVPAAFHLDSREHALMAMEKQTTSGAVGRMTNRNNMMTAIPIGSMYGILPNVGKYTIHGSYGYLVWFLVLYNYWCKWNPRHVPPASSAILSSFRNHHASIDAISPYFNMFQEVLHQQPENQASQSPSTSQLCKYTLILTNPTATTFNLQRNHHHPTLTGWWLNHPIWKICSSNWKSSPIFGVQFLKKYLSCQYPVSSFHFFKGWFNRTKHPKQQIQSFLPATTVIQCTQSCCPTKIVLPIRSREKTAHKQKKKHFVKQRTYFRVVFFPPPHKWNYIEIHEINNKMWICDRTTRIMNPKSLWMANMSWLFNEKLRSGVISVSALWSSFNASSQCPATPQAPMAAV